MTVTSGLMLAAAGAFGALLARADQDRGPRNTGGHRGPKAAAPTMPMTPPR